MTTLTTQTAPTTPTAQTTLTAPTTCTPWCLGPAHHVAEGAAVECVSPAVDLAPGVQAWLQCVAGAQPRVVVCGVAPELDSDAMQVFLTRLAGLWARMV